MCVLAMAWQAHPQWRLVVAGNRDELHARPAERLHRWDEPRGLLAGRDMEGGGTWMGVSEEGRLAVVTNLRGFGAPIPRRPSRGALVRDWLAGRGRFADPGDATLEGLNPFNLVLVKGGEASFWRNRPVVERVRLAPGQIFGLSNGDLDEPWPKTVRLKSLLNGWISSGADHPKALLDALADEAPPTPQGPVTPPSDVPQEPRQSPIFIRNPIYGTRSSTVVAIDASGRGVIFERRYDASGEPAGETGLTFAWPW